MPASPWLVLGAAALEAAVGYPNALHRRLPHPVVWIGGLISALEAGLNHSGFSQVTRRLLGIATLAIIVCVSAMAGWLVTCLGGPWAIMLIGTLGLAQRSLFDHVRAVAKPLAAGDLDSARITVGHIVGRDVARLSESDIATAAIESLAESFCDGVVAPLFWFVIAGLPGLFVDLLNLIPARLAGVVIALAGRGGWRVMLRDAGKHASPNAGWPEAAMAGALGGQLGGPAWYDGALSQRPVLGEGRAAKPADLARALRIYLLSCGLLWLMLAAIGFAWGRFAWPR